MSCIIPILIRKYILFRLPPKRKIRIFKTFSWLKITFVSLISFLPSLVYHIIITRSNNSNREIRLLKSRGISKRMNFIMLYILFRITLFAIIRLYFFSLFHSSNIFRLIFILSKFILIILLWSLHLLLLIMLSQYLGSF